MEGTPGAVDCSGGRIWPKTFRAVPPAASSSRTHLPRGQSRCCHPQQLPGGGGFKEIKTRGVLRPPGRDKTHGDRGCGKCPGMRRGCPEPKIYKLGGKPPRGGPGAGAGQAGRREAGPPSPSPRGRGRGRGGGDGGGSPGKAARAAPPLGLEVCCWKGREKKKGKKEKK